MEADVEWGVAGDQEGGEQQGEGGGGNDGLAMDDDFYQRDVLWWVYQFLRFVLEFDERKINK